MKKIWAVFRKDVRIEFRTKDSLTSMLFFGIVVLVVFNFSIEALNDTVRSAIPGILWIAFMFSGTLGLNRLFAAETENVLHNAKEKMASKNLDMIVVNDVSKKDAGFDVDTNRVNFILKDGSNEELPLLSKEEVANRLLDKIKKIRKGIS